MQNTPRKRLGGFSLIELLTVIAIIGILAAIIIPTVGKVRETAQRTVDSNNLREIGKAAAIYATDNRDVLPNPGSSRPVNAPTQYWQWLGQLARYADLNDPNTYISKIDSAIDPAAAGAVLTVLDPQAPAPTVLTAFSNLRTTSFNVVAGLRLSDPSTTPVAFTRGLQTDGTWNGTAADGDIARGVYSEAGGHIVFLGGNVQFASNLVPNVGTPLVGNNGQGTGNLLQALPRPGSGATGVRVLGMDSGNGVASESGTPSAQATGN